VGALDRRAVATGRGGDIGGVFVHDRLAAGVLTPRLPRRERAAGQHLVVHARPLALEIDERMVRFAQFGDIEVHGHVREHEAADPGVRRRTTGEPADGGRALRVGRRFEDGDVHPRSVNLPVAVHRPGPIGEEQARSEMDDQVLPPVRVEAVEQDVEPLGRAAVVGIGERAGTGLVVGPQRDPDFTWRERTGG